MSPGGNGLLYAPHTAATASKTPPSLSISILTCQTICVHIPTLTLTSLCGAVHWQCLSVLHWCLPLALHTHGHRHTWMHMETDTHRCTHRHRHTHAHGCTLGDTHTHGHKHTHGCARRHTHTDTHKQAHGHICTEQFKVHAPCLPDCLFDLDTFTGSDVLRFKPPLSSLHITCITASHYII